MLSLGSFDWPDLTREIDIDAMAEAAEKAAREKMRRKGLARGQNLRGAPQAAVDAAAKELAEQLDDL